MAEFHVWAPRAAKVQVEVRGERIPLTPLEHGWWIADAPGAGPGDDYAFRLDDGPPLPDPRSSWQPRGVHGSSRLIDHQAFAWTDLGFQAPPLSSAVIYELHVGTFTHEGTFEAIIPKLEHLKSLGVTHLELMPVADFPGKFGWGYDGVCLFAPRHLYGGPEGLKRLVNACHQKGLGVLLDVVYNHLGPNGNYLSQFGPYFTDRHQTPWGSALNFDGPYSDEVRRYFCDNAVMWLRDYHFDGLRLDAVHAIVDTSAIPFLEQLATEIDELKAHLGRHLVLIAESDLNDPRVVRPWEMGGFGIDAQWCDDFHHSVHSVITGERGGYYADFGTIDDLATGFEQPYIYAGRHSIFRQRQHGRPPIGLSAHRFVTYIQNHDQLGNRAQGDRICHIASPQRGKIAAALVLTSPYIPMLFQGEEWSASAPFQYFADWSDEPELAKAVAEGRRNEFRAFGWNPEEVPDPTAPETYLRSRLNWDELATEPHAEMVEWYRQLIRLRRQLSALSDGRLDYVSTAYSEADQWLAVERGPVTILCNFNSQDQSVPIPPEQPKTVLLASAEPVEIDGDTVRMPGNCVAILGPEDPEDAFASRMLRIRGDR